MGKRTCSICGESFEKEDDNRCHGNGVCSSPCLHKLKDKLVDGLMSLSSDEYNSLIDKLGVSQKFKA